MAYNEFDPKKYKRIFDNMYGSGKFDAGLSQAREVGKTTAQAEFEKDMYAQRLKEAQDAARQAAEDAQAELEAAEAEGDYQEDTGQSVDDLVNEFRKDKTESNKSGISKYYENQTKQLNKGRSLARKPVEEVFPQAVPSLRDNPNLSAWEKMKLFGG
jgi:alkylated DNA nucleotide flippase Atl1